MRHCESWHSCHLARRQRKGQLPAFVPSHALAGHVISVWLPADATHPGARGWTAATALTDTASFVLGILGQSREKKKGFCISRRKRRESTMTRTRLPCEQGFVSVITLFKPTSPVCSLSWRCVTWHIQVSCGMAWGSPCCPARWRRFPTLTYGWV